MIKKTQKNVILKIRKIINFTNLTLLIESTLGGMDIFLDSVGGSMYNTVLSNHMNLGGRICIFGNLSLYNNHSNMEMVPSNDLIISLKVS